MSDQGDLEALWAAHTEEPTEETMEQLVLAYVPLARYLAQRALAKAPPYQDREDILSYAHHGLLDAIKRFEPGRGFKFETYATRRIAGAIIDGQRRQDPLSRSMRKRVKQMETAMRDLEVELEREPTLDEIALRMETSVDEVRQLRINRQSLASSLDLVMAPDHGGQGQSAFNEEHAEDVDLEIQMQEISDALAPLLARLTDRERAFIVLHYIEGMTLREAAKSLGLHETRTGQLRTAIMRRISPED